METSIRTIRRALQLLRIGWLSLRVRQASDEQQRLLARQALTDVLSATRGISMKVGQLFAQTDTGDPMHRLVKSIDPLPLQRIQPAIEASLERPLKAVFRTIEESRAAASLGQVHRASLLDGTAVAIKVQYPDMADAVAAELRLAGLMPGAGPVKRWEFDLQAYKQTLGENMQRELDYRSEALRQQDFAQKVQVPGLSVPRIYPELCSESLLVQSWASGVALSESAHWRKKQRLLVAQTLLTTLFKSLFVAGSVHADPHPGNALYELDTDGYPTVHLLDFGCMVEVSEVRRMALLKLIVAHREQLDINLLQLFAALGFDAQKLSHIHGELGALAQILLKPFLVNHPFSLDSWQLSESFQALLAERRWWFRAAGPSDLFLLMRSFQGLMQQFQQLDVRLPWWPVLQRAVGPDYLQRARVFELPALPTGLSVPTESIDVQARKLCVQITGPEQEPWQLDMPAETVLDLPHVIPEDVLQQIQGQQGVTRVVQQVRESGMVPQELLAFHQKGKAYRLWLE